MIATAADIAALRAETNTKIEGIKNTAHIIPTTSRVYYVSNSGSDSNNGTSKNTPFKTISKVNSAISSRTNVTVCFERGGVWRGEQLVAVKGLTVTAYGTGAKPVIMGSPENGGGSANVSKWTDMGNNIWRYEGSQNWTDVGNIIFNDGESYAKKIVQLYVKQEGWANHALTDFTNAPAQKYSFKSYTDLKNDLDFYHDKDFDDGDGSSGATGYLYLCSTSNPATRFNSIEFATRNDLVYIHSTDNVTIDNICFKYEGGHAIAADGQPTESGWGSTDLLLEDLLVQNCEFYWIGGSIHDRIDQSVIGTVPPGNWVADVRYGNAIEVYGTCDGFIAKNNYIYQVFDAGITVQKTVGSSSKDWSQKNIQFIDNVIENCNYSIEYFLTDIPSGNSSKMENFVISGNYMWNAGVGFCSTRPVWDQGFAAHIKSQKTTPCNNATGFEITDNVMVGIGSSFLLIRSSFGESSLPLFEGNRLYGYYDMEGTAKDGFQIGVVSGNTDGKEKEVYYDTNVEAYLAQQLGSKYGENNKYYFIF